MGAISIRHPFIDDMFKALGIDQNMVKSVELRIVVDEVVSVKIEYLVDSDDLDKSTIFKDYILSVSEIVKKEDKL